MRHFSSFAPLLKPKRLKVDAQHPLKCGLEIHSQLSTQNKLFSLSETSFLSKPNSKVSYFDSALPGTQPVLNREALLYALKACKALDCEINLSSSFDRKHYFYGDQPQGYQITQHYNPIARNGSLQLNKEDGMPAQKLVGIEQIQLEQDTGKSIYSDSNELISKIDLNRTNTPLIEMVTQPQFTHPDEVKIFIRKFQNLLRHLDICTGDLETGAMRVDVNISVDGFPRVELKNLSTTSAVTSAIEFEYNRQLQLILAGKGAEIIQETRGWTGNSTVRLRTKEDSLDYRYMPDPELPLVQLANFIDEIELPKLPDQILRELLSAPYNLSLKDANILVYDLTLLDYYLKLFSYVSEKGLKNTKLPGNWLIHELLGFFNNILKAKFDPSLMKYNKLGELIVLIDNNKISNSSAKLLLNHLLNTPSELSKPMEALIDEYELGFITPENANLAEIDTICREIVAKYNENVLKLEGDRLIQFLVGKGMREFNGRIDSKFLGSRFKAVLEK